MCFLDITIFRNLLIITPETSNPPTKSSRLSFPLPLSITQISIPQSMIEKELVHSN